MFSKLTLNFLFAALIVAASAFAFPVNALSYSNLSAAEAGCGTRGVVIDFACQREKLLTPTASCGIYICVGDREFGTPSEALDLNFFGVRINAKDDNLLQTMIFVGFNVFLGAVVMVVALYGVRGAFLRARAESDEDLMKANKVMTNAVFGIGIIAVSFILAQLIASFLGLGSINEIVSFDEFNLQTDTSPTTP
jgi:hypothetical protein